MDYMNECKSSIYRSLDNICSCMLDENTNEEILPVFRDLVLEGGYQNSSIMTTLESICNDRGKNIGFGSSVINTYPFGQITNETHNLFLGICAGKTTFLSLMKAVNTYCGRAYMNHGEKQVVVLTTQWNPVIFSRFEPVFLDYALHHEFRFLFFLVNEYGAARIPFFDYKNPSYGSLPPCFNIDTMEVYHKLKTDDVCYTESFSTWEYMKTDSSYIFDFKRRILHYSTFAGNGKVRLPENAIMAFARDIAFLLRSTPRNCVTNCMDCGSKSLDIFGEHLSWFDNNEAYKGVEEAVLKLISYVK